MKLHIGVIIPILFGCKGDIIYDNPTARESILQGSPERAFQSFVQMQSSASCIGPTCKAEDTVMTGDPAVDFVEGVWMGAYFANTGKEEIVEYLTYDENKELLTDVFEERIKKARYDALKLVLDNVDMRLGSWRAGDPTFPDACRIFNYKEDKECVYLFSLPGGEGTKFLPINLPSTPKVSVENAQCIDLTNENFYTQYGSKREYFWDEESQSPNFLSLRIQGNVAAILYENNSCTEEREGTLPVLEDGAITFSVDKIPMHNWKFANEVEEGDNHGKEDLIISRLDAPLYERKESACLCPDDSGQYPPTEDSYYLVLWESLSKYDYLKKDVADDEKVGVLKWLMNGDRVDEELYDVIEAYLGKAYTEAVPTDLLPTISDVKAEIRRQTYHAIVVDGAKNMAFPAPDPCDTRFSPAAKRFKSMKLITDYKADNYGKNVCGASAASELRDLLAMLQTQKQADINEKLELEQIATAQLEQARVALEEQQQTDTMGAEAEQSILAGGCILPQPQLCDQLPTKYFPDECNELMSFLVNQLNATLDLSAKVLSAKLNTICGVRCNTCASSKTPT